MPRPIVVVTNQAFPETLALLGERFEVLANDKSAPWSRAETLRRTVDAEGLLAFMTDSVDDAFLAQCPKLRAIACALKGYDNFDLAACNRRGVWLSIVPDLLTEPTAELAIGLAIGLGRHVLAADRVVRDGEFRGWRPRFYGTSLDGSVVAIIGAGNVGRAIARKLSGFSCEILMTDPRPRSPILANARLVELPDALSRADFVMLAVALDASTTHMVDSKWLRRMKRGALLVNPARGSLVDESAVAAALIEGAIGGYAADVFECEDWARADRPRTINPRLIGLADRTLFTTHIGSAVTSVRQAIEFDAALNLIEALGGQRPHGAINEPIGDPVCP